MTLKSIMEVYKFHMAEVQLLLISNQEHRISKLRAEHAKILHSLQKISDLWMEVTELKSEVPQLRVSLNFTHVKIREIKKSDKIIK